MEGLIEEKNKFGNGAFWRESRTFRHNFSCKFFFLEGNNAFCRFRWKRDLLKAFFFCIKHAFMIILHLTLPLRQRRFKQII